MNLDTVNMLVIAVTGLGTLITAIASLRSTETASKNESIRTELEIKRLDRETEYDNVIQGAQTVNTMSIGIIETMKQELMEMRQQIKELDTENDILSRTNTELKLHLASFMRKAEELVPVLEIVELPNGNKDRLQRIINFASELRSKDIVQ